MILYVFTKDGIEYLEIYLVEALFLQKMNHQQLAFFLRFQFQILELLLVSYPVFSQKHRNPHHLHPKLVIHQKCCFFSSDVHILI